MTSTLTQSQKTGILILLTSKVFERLAFYLVLTILIQFLSESLKLETSQAGIYYSVFYGTIGLTSLFSGLIGDLRNRAKTVYIGFILLSISYLAIAFLPGINFMILSALILLGLGIGLLQPNITVFLGNIYNEKENEITGLPGFIGLTAIINIGVLIAPLLSNYLKSNFGFASVFLFAFLCGLISLILFSKFKGIYYKLDLRAEQKESVTNTSSKHLNKIILLSILSIAVLIKFALNQKEITFGFAALDLLENGFDIDYMKGNFEKFISIPLLLIFAAIALQMKSMNWAKVFNLIIIGIIVAIIAFVCIASFSSLSQVIDGKSIFLQSYILLIIAETLISPVIWYTIYRSSPKKYKGLFQGIFYIVFAISNNLLFFGTLLYEKNASMAFWSFAITLVIATILIMVLKTNVRNRLKAY